MSDSGLIVRRATPPDESEWLNLLRTAPSASLYHTPAWGRFISSVFGHREEHLLSRRGTTLTGVLPMFRVKAPWSRARLVSLPYDVGSGGTVATDDESVALLVTEAMRVARHDGLHSLELRPAKPVPVLETLGLERSDLVVVSTLPIESHDATWQRVSTDNRQSIRKAAKRGVTVRPATSVEDYVAFYDVYLKVFRAFGTPPYGRRYFTELYHAFHSSGESRLLLAVVDGRIVGGLLAFVFGRGIVSKFAAVLDEVVDLRVYPALYGACIDLSLELGATWLSWGSSSRAQVGLIDFKRRWGATAETAVRYTLSVTGSPPDIERYYDTDGLARRLWKHLPLPATSVFGGLLNRWFC